MEQQRQNAEIRMGVTLRLAKHYRKNPQPETGEQIKYDIKALRAEPSKLEQWFSEEKQEAQHLETGTY